MHQEIADIERRNQQRIDDAARKKLIEDTFKKEFTDSKYERVSFQVEFGDPGHRIAEYAEAVGSDLIVMPSHGRTGVRRLLIGSVAERVLRFAHCSVMVIKPPHKHED